MNKSANFILQSGNFNNFHAVWLTEWDEVITVFILVLSLIIVMNEWERVYSKEPYLPVFESENHLFIQINSDTFIQYFIQQATFSVEQFKKREIVVRCIFQYKNHCPLMRRFGEKTVSDWQMFVWFSFITLLVIRLSLSIVSNLLQNWFRVECFSLWFEYEKKYLCSVYRFADKNHISIPYFCVYMRIWCV